MLPVSVARLIAAVVVPGFTAPGPEIDRASLPVGQVRVELCEAGIPPANAWPKPAPAATETYSIPAFGISRVPHKYIDTGVRADRPNPFLLRAAAEVELPAGTHRLLLRGRGAARLIVDDRVVLVTRFPSKADNGSGGLDLTKRKYLDLGPDFRFAPPGNREAWTPFRTPGGRHVVVLELIVGGRLGKDNVRRPEPGEAVAAVSLEGRESFTLLGPGAAVPYTDAGWGRYAAAEEARVAALDADRRAAALRSQAGFWDRRRDLARRWLAETPEVPVPPLPPGFPANNAVDHFLAEKLASARKAGETAGTVDYARDVRPIFEAKCLSCHRGAKAKGDLRLDRPSDAVVAGKPDESELIARVVSTDESEVMPPKGDRLTPAEVKTVRAWVAEGANWNTLTAGKLTDLTDDLTFLRRVTLDAVGVIPSPDEIEAFLADPSPGKRARAIDRLLADPRRAGHWVGYWQDVLAENPNILRPTLNNSGPFRWWLHEAFLDAKPFDVVVTELVRMRGSAYEGAPAGFGIASENDVPAAEKGAILASAFLGLNVRCARCHDAPAHKATQEELFGLAAMLAEKPITVPKTSSVPRDKLHTGRQALISVTLQPGTTVAPAWPFADLLPSAPPEAVPAGATPRDRLAAMLTVPQNERFARVVVNRVWQRLMGRGIVEPVDDWERDPPTHPELLTFLAREFVRSGYDLRAVERLVLNSHAYQRAADPARAEPDPLYAAPARRRLTAEQVVDSLFAAAGKPMDVGAIDLDIDNEGYPNQDRISLGVPERAWEFASTANERDRPSLSLPKVQPVVDLLEAFGWRPTRPDPISVRDTAPNVLQPATLANGTVGYWLTRLSDDHAGTRLAVEARTPEELAERLYLRVLTRKPTAEEKAATASHLAAGFADRFAPPPPPEPAGKRTPARYVSWSNHLIDEANALKIELEAAARRGDPPTARLTPEWRSRMEDAVWAVLNAPEFVFTP